MTEPLDITKVPLDELETVKGCTLQFVGQPNAYGVCVVVFDTDMIVSVLPNGCIKSSGECYIRRKKKRIKGWMNIYPGANLYPNTDAASEGAYPDRIACIYIDVEEGEGL